MNYPANLSEAEAHLGAAITQSVPSDDQIIKEHMVAAHALLEAHRREFEEMARQPEVQSFHYEGGETNVAMRHPIVAHMARELAEFFKDAGGTNYIALEFDTDIPGLGPLYLTVQRKFGKTPHQLKVEAESKASGLTQFVEMVALLTATGECPGCHGTEIVAYTCQECGIDIDPNPDPEDGAETVDRLIRNARELLEPNGPFFKRLKVPAATDGATPDAPH